MIIFLDSGVIGLLCNPNPHPEAIAITRWFERMLCRGAYIISSTICDYEVRRGLRLSSLQGGSTEGINKLNLFQEVIEFIPVTLEIADMSAELWAESKQQGKSTAQSNSLDADIVICASYRVWKSTYPGREIVIATTNVKHLSRFANALEWSEINL
jgi:predicted nucleic acid-binding protein